MGIQFKVCSGESLDFLSNPTEFRSVMAPVEQSTLPPHERRLSLTELKVVEKAMELPVVSDTVEEIERVKNTLSENAHVVSAKQLVSDGIKILAENPTVQDGIHTVQDGFKVLHDNPRVQQTIDTVKDTVLPRVVEAVEQLDTIACGGIASLKTALPVLSNPTPELVETTKETARNYFSLATEYMASFVVSQLSLQAADKSLATVEKSVKFFKPDKKDDGIVCVTYSKIRDARRTLRALRRAGERRNHIEMDKLARAGFMGRVASILSVNYFLNIFGLELSASKPERCLASMNPVVDEVDESELHELKGDLGGYRSDEDPDYKPCSEDDSLDSSSTSLNSSQEAEDVEPAGEAGEEQVDQPAQEGQQYGDYHY